MVAGSAAQMLIAVAIGSAVGLGVRAVYGGSPSGLKYAVDWVGLPGKAFVNLMKCFDLPLIALNIIVGVQVRARGGGEASVTQCCYTRMIS